MIENGRGEQTGARSHWRTRRHLLVGGAAAVGAVAAGALARATPAAAANGDPITMGQVNQASSNTAINDSGGDTAFTALGTSNGTALEGDAVDGIGVSGTSVTGIGVSATTGSMAAGAAAAARRAVRAVSRPQCWLSQGDTPRWFSAIAAVGPVFSDRKRGLVPE